MTSNSKQLYKFKPLVRKQWIELTLLDVQPQGVEETKKDKFKK